MTRTPSGRLRNAWSTASEDSRGISAWQPPRIVPRLTSDRRLDPLIYGYRYDPEFKQCRRRSVRRHGELIEAIAAKSLRLMTDRPGRGLKRAVKRFLRSPWVHFDVLHSTWLDVDGPYGHLTLAERQAGFYALWKDRQDGDELPWSLDPSVACSEPFYRRGKSKGEGRWRTFYSFGIARTTRQRLVCAALSAASCNQYRDQAIYRGGMSVVVSEITRMLRDDARLTHCAEVDIRNCFDTIRLAAAHDVLPLSPKVIQQTVAINPQEAIDHREREHRRHDHYLRRCDGSFASGTSLALPQGAASSSLVAYWLIEAGLPPLPPGRVFLYGDNLLVLGESSDDVRAQVCRFRELFERHPAGPLQITCEDPVDMRDGFEFLGIEFRRVQMTTGDIGRYFLSARVPPEARRQFLDSIRSRAVGARECGDTTLSAVSQYARGFLWSRPTHDRVELLVAACTVIEDLGIDATPIWELGVG